MPFKFIALAVALFTTTFAIGQDKNSESKEKDDRAMKERYNNIVPVKDSIFILKNRGGNIGLSIGKDGIYMIDSQFENISEENLATIRLLSDKPIRILVNTHHHGDHTGGNDTFKMEGAIVMAHSNVEKRIAGSKRLAAAKKRREQIEAARKKVTQNVSGAELKANEKKYERMAEEQAGTLDSYMEEVANMPTVTFERSLDFNYNQRIKLLHVRRAHTDGDAIVHFTESNVIHTGDVFFKGKYPFIDLDSGGSVDGAIEALRIIIAMSDPQTMIIPGHGDIANIKDVKYSMGMLRSLREAVAYQIKSKKTKDQILKMRSLTSEYDLKGFGDGFITTEKMLEVLYLDYLRKNGINEDTMN